MICISRRPHSPSSAEAEPDLDIWLITYEPANLEVAITSGENKGKTLKYVNVVRRVESVGFLGLEESGGGEFWVDLDSYGKDGEGEGQGLVVLVQKGEGGEIVDAVTL